MDKMTWKGIAIGFVVITLLFIGQRSFKVIPAGYVAVVTLFGEVNDEIYPSGLHAPINPLYKWHLFDVRQKSLPFSGESVPTQDQLVTKIDIAVQWRLLANETPRILRETGETDQIIEVHLTPTIRSVLREHGKRVPRAEDFFLEKTQEILRSSVREELIKNLHPKGIEIQDVLVNNIELPNFITKAIESKKEREQAVEKQKAELERYKTEKAQIVAQASSEYEAAQLKAKEIKLIAEARAFEIKTIGTEIENNPLYIKLRAMKALETISTNPASQIYFLNGDSPSPLPLLNIVSAAGQESQNIKSDNESQNVKNDNENQRPIP